MSAIEQGESFDFKVAAGDATAASFEVKQYPGDTAAITRAMTLAGTDFIDTLTSAETAALAIGQWFIHIQLTNTTDDIREPVKLYVSKGWL